MEYIEKLENEVYRLEQELESWRDMFFWNSFEVKINLSKPWTHLEIHVNTYEDGFVIRAWKHHESSGHVPRFWNGETLVPPDFLNKLSFSFDKDLVKECPTALVKRSDELLKILREISKNHF